jgi:hypothetical protein
MNAVIAEKVNSAIASIANTQKDIEGYLRLEALIGDLDLSDFRYFYTLRTPEELRRP